MIEHVRRQLHAVAILGALSPRPSGSVQSGPVRRFCQQLGQRLPGGSRLTRNNKLALKVHVCDRVVEERAAPQQVRRIRTDEDQVGRDPE